MNITDDIKDSFLSELDLDEAANVLGGYLECDYSYTTGRYRLGSNSAYTVQNQTQLAEQPEYNVSGVNSDSQVGKSRYIFHRTSDGNYFLFNVGS